MSYKSIIVVRKNLIMSMAEKIITDALCLLGYHMVKPEQMRVIEEFISGRDVFVCLPTGFGKSLIFASLPIIFDKLRNQEHKSIVVIVSPLLSIMQDQVGTFLSKGISATSVTSSTDFDVKQQVVKGNFNLCL